MEIWEFYFQPFGLCSVEMHFIKKQEWLQLTIPIIRRLKGFGNFLSEVTELANATATSLNSKILALCPALFPPHQSAVLIALEIFAKGDIFSNLVLIIFFIEALIQASANIVTF